MREQPDTLAALDDYMREHMSEGGAFRYAGKLRVP